MDTLPDMPTVPISKEQFRLEPLNPDVPNDFILRKCTAFFLHVSKFANDILISPKTELLVHISTYSTSFPAVVASFYAVVASFFTVVALFYAVLLLHRFPRSGVVFNCGIVFYYWCGIVFVCCGIVFECCGVVFSRFHIVFVKFRPRFCEV